MNRHLYQICIAVLLFAVAAAAVSCVNKDYRVDEINTEVHLAPNGLGVPIAVIDRQTIGDLLKKQEDLVVGDDGSYAFRYGDDIVFNVDGINVGGVGDIGDAFQGMQVDLGIPAFDFEDDTSMEPISINPTGSFPVGIPSVPIIVAVPYSGSVSTSDGTVTIDVDLPDEIEKVRVVSLGGIGAGGNPDGSLIKIKLYLNGLKPVTGSLKINSVSAVLPDIYTLGVYQTYGASTTVSGNVFSITDYDVPAVQIQNDNIEVAFYIKSLDMSELPIVSGNIHFDQPFSCSVNYTITTNTAGNMVGATPPSASLTGQPSFRDASFTTKAINVDESAVVPLDYQLSSIPAEVVRVAGVDFDNAHKTITVTVPDPGLPFNTSPDIKVTFPPELSLTDPNGKISGNVLTAPLSAFATGYTLQLNGINLGAKGVPVGGTIDLSAFDDIKAEIKHTFPSQDFLWSRDIQNLEINSLMDIGVAADLEVSTVRVVLDLPLDEHIGNIDPIDLSSLTDILGSEEQHPDLTPPTIIMSITNSAGIEIRGDLALDPKNKSGVSLGKVEIDDIVIAPSADGTPTETNILIAAQGATVPTGYTPYYTALGNLMETLPSTVAVSLSAWATPEVEHSIRVNQDFPFSMSYNIDMPIEFGPDMDIVVEIDEDGLNETFADLAEYKVKVADITVHAELAVSFPFKVSGITAQFLDADGERIDGLDADVTGAIEGPAPGAGGTKTSTLSISLSVPNGGDFAALSAIDRLKLRLPLTGTGAANSLRPDDYLSGRVWLTLDKGIHIDPSKL